jgi:hypothetical protein
VGGFTDGHPAVSETADGGLLAVATTGNDTDVWQRQQRADGHWSPWSLIATPAAEVTQTPTLVSNADARLELFVRTLFRRARSSAVSPPPSGYLITRE